MPTDRSELHLTVGAVFCRCLMWFPVWMLLLSVLDGGAKKLLPCCGILLASAFLTALWARFWKLRFAAYPMRAIAAVCMLLIPMLFAVPWVLWRMTGGIMTVILPSAVTLIFLAWTADGEPDTLFSVKIYTAFLTLSVLGALLLAAVQLPVPTTLLLTVISVESCGFFLLRNQFMLRRMLNRRSVRESEVPPEIRRGNLLLAVGIILLLMGIVLCRAPFLRLLGWLREVTVLLAAMLLRGFSRLIAMLGGNAPEAEADQAHPTGEPQIPETAAGNPFWLLIWVPVILIAIYIWRVFLSEWVYDIREAISLLIQRLRSSRQQETGRLLAQNAAYTDTETREKPRPSAGRLRRNWKKKLRAWHKMPGSCEKFYAGYLLLLEAPAWRENLPHDADTVQEIRGQWQRLYGTELDAVTDDFEVHRYAEKPLPEDALSAMVAALERAAIR